MITEGIGKIKDIREGEGSSVFTSHSRQPVPPYKFLWYSPRLLVECSHFEHLPSNLQQLTFCNDFNIKENLLSLLPSTLTHLTLGHDFNQPVTTLPPSLAHLTFGNYFNLPVDNKLSSTITHLTFGHFFNQSVHALPSSITHLTFGNTFNRAVDTLPSTSPT